MTSLHRPLEMIVRKAEAFDVELPAHVLDGYRHLQTLHEQGNGEQSTDHDLHVAYSASIDAGNDPLTDPAVTELAARHALGSSTVTSNLRQRAKQLLHEDAEAVFASFAPAFDRAAALLKKAHGTLGNVQLHVAKSDPSKSRLAVDQAVVGDEAIIDLLMIWKTLGIDGAGFPWDKRRQTLVYTDPDPALWFDVRPDFQHVRPWDAVCAGLPLSLATSPAVFRARVKALETYAAEQADAVERAARERLTARSAGNSRSLTLADMEAASA